MKVALHIKTSKRGKRYAEELQADGVASPRPGGRRGPGAAYRLYLAANSVSLAIHPDNRGRGERVVVFSGPLSSLDIKDDVVIPLSILHSFVAVDDDDTLAQRWL